MMDEGMDEDRQASDLRTGVDRELAGVRATAAARELLTNRMAATGRARGDRQAHGRRRLASAVVLPLAAAAVLVAVVVVPSYLRSADSQPGGQPGVTESAPASTRAPTASPPASAAPNTPSAAAALTITARPRTGVVGQLITLTVTDSLSRLRAVAPAAAAAAAGDPTAAPATGPAVQNPQGIPDATTPPPSASTLTVTWGDGSVPTQLSGICERVGVASSARLPTHTYQRAGRFQITVLLDGCGLRPGSGKLSFAVLGATPTPAPKVS
jgi:hypothetical protein